MNEHTTPDSGHEHSLASMGFPDPGNNEEAEEIDPGVWKRIDTFIEQHPGGQERLIPLLHQLQESLGYLPFAVQEYVADKLGMSPIQVYGVVSFYHLFTTTPRGRYRLKVCMGTACFVRHSGQLIETIRSVLGLKLGETTNDRLFSLEQVRCIGACGLAPAMMVNNDVHGNLSPEAVRELLTRLLHTARREAKKEGDSVEASSD